METAEGDNHQNHGFGDIAALLLPPAGQLQCGHFGRTAGSMSGLAAPVGGGEFVDAALAIGVKAGAALERCRK
jgi:hydrogenase/urease accessory protein HupE